MYSRWFRLCLTSWKEVKVYPRALILSKGWKSPPLFPPRYHPQALRHGFLFPRFRHSFKFIQVSKRTRTIAGLLSVWTARLIRPWATLLDITPHRTDMPFHSSPQRFSRGLKFCRFLSYENFGIVVTRMTSFGSCTCHGQVDAQTLQRQRPKPDM